MYRDIDYRGSRGGKEVMDYRERGERDNYRDKERGRDRVGHQNHRHPVEAEAGRGMMAVVMRNCVAVLLASAGEPEVKIEARCLRSVRFLSLCTDCAGFLGCWRQPPAVRMAAPEVGGYLRPPPPPPHAPEVGGDRPIAAPETVVSETITGGGKDVGSRNKVVVLICDANTA